MSNHSSVYNKVFHCWTHRSADVQEYLKQTLCNEHVPTIRHESSSRSWSEDTKITWVNVLILIPNWFVMLTVSWCVDVSLLTQIPQQSACQQPIMYSYSLTVWLTVSLQLWVERKSKRALPSAWKRRRRRGICSYTPLPTVTLPRGFCRPLNGVLSLQCDISPNLPPLSCPLHAYSYTATAYSLYMTDSRLHTHSWQSYVKCSPVLACDCITI